MASIEKKFVAVDEQLYGDQFIDVFDSAEEASEAAEQAWNHLTQSERKNRHIYSAMVTANDLCEDAFDDEEIDWTFFHSCNPCGFDSDALH